MALAGPRSGAMAPFSGGSPERSGLMLPRSHAAPFDVNRSMTPNTLALTPDGRLTAVSVPDAPQLPFELAEPLVMDSVLGSGQVLLGLGAEHVGAALPPVIAWWRDLAVRYLTALCTLPEVAEHLPGRVLSPNGGELQALTWSAPPMDGAEYLSVGVLERLCQELDAWLHAELQASGQPLGVYLKARHPAWNLVGRIHVHLAENRKDKQFPFAFLATCTTRLQAPGRAAAQSWVATDSTRTTRAPPGSHPQAEDNSVECLWITCRQPRSGVLSGQRWARPSDSEPRSECCARARAHPAPAGSPRLARAEPWA